MLRKRDSIAPMVTSRVHKSTHKNDIDATTEIEHVNRLDAKNRNNFCIKAIDNDVHDMGMAFEILDEKSPTLVDHKKVTDYLLFDVKINFMCKALLVLG